MTEAVHLILPGHEIGRAPLLAGETVSGFLARAGWSTNTLPTICVVNGAPVMRAEWDARPLDAEDRLVFLSRPLGGGSASTKQVLGLVAMIGLSVLAPGVGTALGGGLLGALGQFAFMAGGAYAVSTMVKAKAADQNSETETVYSFGQQSNSVRVLEPIAVSYGRVKKTPGYAAVPWAEYIGDDQYLNVLLCQGCGKYSTGAIYVDDTVLWTAADGVSDSFDGVDIQFYGPGQPVTLFDVNVATSAEVAGQEITGDWTGGFVVAVAGTTTKALAIDVAAPGGLYYTSDDGTVSAYFVQLHAEYRPIDGLGLPTGPWSALTDPAVGAASKKARRWSFKVAVTPGRYEVRLKRDVNPLDSDTKTVSTLVWMGLRAFLNGGDSFQGVSTIAIRMRATQQLTDASARNIKVIDTRILPVFNGATWVEQPTRNPAWAFWDIATNTDYGARRAAGKVDAQAAYSLATLATSRGDYFDYEFSSAVSVLEAFDTALATVRAKHRWSGDVLTLVRDEWSAVPSMLVTDREMIRGSFTTDYDFMPSDGTDAVILQYVDETTWRGEEVQYPADYDALYPKRLTLPGIVQRAHAYREAGFHFRQNVYRRVKPSFDMEHDGRLVSLGTQLLVQSDMPGAWGSAGMVVGRTGVALTLEPAPTWVSGSNHYIALRTRTGGLFGPVLCDRYGDDAICALNAADLASVEAGQGMTLDDALARMDGAELPSYAFGVGTAWQRRCIALTGAPSGNRVSLSLVVDDPRVHDDDGAPDALPSLPPLSMDKAPTVTGLIAQLEQNVLEPVLTASWYATSGASYYMARISYDAGDTWTALPDTTATELSMVVQPAALRLAVAAVGSSRGAWAYVDLAAPTIDAGNIPVTMGNFTDETYDRVVTRMQDAIDVLNDGLSRLSLIAANIDAAGELNRQDLTRAISVQVGSARASFNEQITVLANETTAIASQVTDLEASMANVDASLKARFVVAVTPSGAIAAYELQATAENASAGLRVIAQDDGAGHAIGQVSINADRFFITGNEDIGTAVFLVDNTGATPVVYLNGDLIASGSITASKLSVAELSAIVANLGEIVAGIIRSADSRFYISANDGYILVTS